MPSYWRWRLRWWWQYGGGCSGGYGGGGVGVGICGSGYGGGGVGGRSGSGFEIVAMVPVEKAYGLRNVGGNTRRFILTMSYVIKVMGKFLVLDNNIPQKTKQIQTAFF